MHDAETLTTVACPLGDLEVIHSLSDAPPRPCFCKTVTQTKQQPQLMILFETLHLVFTQVYFYICNFVGAPL